MKNFMIRKYLQTGSHGTCAMLIGRAFIAHAIAINWALLIALQCSGQVLSYMKSYGGPNEEYGLQVLPVNDEQGGHIIVGATGSYGQAATNIAPNAYILRTDDVGSRIWSISAGGSGYDFLNMVVEVADGWLAVGSVNYGGPNSDVLLMRISGAGALMWSKRIGTPEWNEVGDQILALEGDEFIITGSRMITGGGVDGDVLVMKINGQGDLLWTSLFGSDLQDSPTDIISTGDGGFLLSGVRYAIPNQQAFLLKLDAVGVLEWERTWQALQGSVTISRMLSASDGGSILIGQGNSGLQLWKVNSMGAVTLSRSYLQGAYISSSYLGMYNGSYLIVGSTSNADYTMPRMMAMRVYPLGEVFEARSYAGNLGDSNGRSAVVEAEGGVTMVGSLSTGGGDVLMVRTQVGNGGLDAFCYHQEETVASTTPVEFAVINGLYATQNAISPAITALSWVVNPSSTETTHCTNLAVPDWRDPVYELMAFPNPATDRVTLQWRELIEYRVVELSDASGRVVLSTLGRGEVMLDVSALAAGPYIVRASNDRTVLRSAIVVQ